MIQIPNTHVPTTKNRSSKQNFSLCGVRSAIRSASGKTLEKLTYGGCREAIEEARRRKDLQLKKSMKKQ